MSRNVYRNLVAGVAAASLLTACGRKESVDAASIETGIKEPTTISAVRSPSEQSTVANLYKLPKNFVYVDSDAATITTANKPFTDYGPIGYQILDCNYGIVTNAGSVQTSGVSSIALVGPARDRAAETCSRHGLKPGF